jgi:hypothetical protein
MPGEGRRHPISAFARSELRATSRRGKGVFRLSPRNFARCIRAESAGLSGWSHFEAYREARSIEFFVNQPELRPRPRFAQEGERLSIGRPGGIVLDDVTFVIKVGRSTLVASSIRVDDHEVSVRCGSAGESGKVGADDDVVGEVEVKATRTGWSAGTVLALPFANQCLPVWSELWRRRTALGSKRIELRNYRENGGEEN